MHESKQMICTRRMRNISTSSIIDALTKSTINELVKFTPQEVHVMGHQESSKTLEQKSRPILKDLQSLIPSCNTYIKYPPYPQGILKQPCDLTAASKRKTRTDLLILVPSSCVLHSISHRRFFFSALSWSLPCHCHHVSVDSTLTTDPLSVCHG